MNIFNKIPLLKPKRNVFNLGFENRLTTDYSRLTPFFIKEALPDDVWKLRAEVFGRVMPALNAPIMQRVNVRVYWFFVPIRIIWEDFEKWINPKSGVSDIVAPRLNFSNSGAGELLFRPRSLGDYLGVNAGYSPEDFTKMVNDQEYTGIFPRGESVSSLPFRAYQKIYSDWFIDLNNVDLPEFSIGSGVETVSIDNTELYENLLKIRHRAWEHDYFTSSMPDPQRGPDVMAFDGGGVDPSDLSISSNPNVPITRLSSSSPALTSRITGIAIRDSNDSIISLTPSQFVQQLPTLLGITGGASEFNMISAGIYSPLRVEQDNEGDYYFKFTTESTYEPMVVSKSVHSDGVTGSADSAIKVKLRNPVTVEDLDADLIIAGPSPNALYFDNEAVANGLKVVSSPSSGGTAQGVTVEELRIRMQMQSFLERNEIGGSRYTEMLYAHWGVKDADGRLQRSEFIGGHKQPLMINEISQTSQPNDDDPLGQYAGQGTTGSPGKTIRYRVPEHGFIIGIVSIMPRTGYFQGLSPMWKRFDRLDYFWPSFAHLGEQEVKNREVLFSGYDPDGTFGYQQRYAEYKASNDEVHGDMKASLAFWHSARAFASPTSADDIPKLNGDFTTPSFSGADGIDRIFPVASSENYWHNTDHFVLDIYNHAMVSRRMPKFVTPRNSS